MDRQHARNSCSCPKLLIWSEHGKRHKEAAGNDEQEAFRRAREKQANLQAITEGRPAPEKITRVTVADAVEQFLKTKRDEGYREKSINRLVLWFQPAGNGRQSQHAGFLGIRGGQSSEPRSCCRYLQVPPTVRLWLEALFAGSVRHQHS